MVSPHNLWSVYGLLQQPMVCLQSPVTTCDLLSQPVVSCHNLWSVTTCGLLSQHVVSCHNMWSPVTTYGLSVVSCHNLLSPLITCYLVVISCHSLWSSVTAYGLLSQPVVFCHGLWSSVTAYGLLSQPSVTSHTEVYTSGCPLACFCVQSWSVSVSSHGLFLCPVMVCFCVQSYTCTLVVALPGGRHCSVNAGTGCPGYSIP